MAPAEANSEPGSHPWWFDLERADAEVHIVGHGPPGITDLFHVWSQNCDTNYRKKVPLWDGELFYARQSKERQADD